QIGIIAPITPIINPSIINGNLIVILLAPTRRIISIALRRLNIVNLIVLLIKKAVTIIKAITITTTIFSITLNADTMESTIPSPYLTVSTLEIVAIYSAVSDKCSTSLTFTIKESIKGFSSK